MGDLSAAAGICTATWIGTIMWVLILAALLS